MTAATVSLWRFAGLRLASAALTVLGVITVVFMLVHLIPGDPVEVMLGESARPAERAELRAALGLDRPLPVQWLDYLGRLARGDLGRSLHSRAPVRALLAERLPYTALLAGAALGVALAVALPLGIGAALRRGTPLDTAAMVFALAGVAVPNFWLGPLLILVFAIGLGWLPVSGAAGPAAIVLPALTLGTALAAILARMLRAALLEVLEEDYVLAARARGLPERVVIGRHALRNAAVPVVTVLGLQLGALLAGAVITETIFAWPGIGSLAVDAIHRRDFPVVQACVLVVSLVWVVVNAFTDLACAALDPRLGRRP